ncbi:PLP-dependent cysteine synthase family protein [Oryzihumus sp.]|uniref:PLP-dependent cysteine synthase family protein n=1 Tax=Oryzihumus sp. TaxID=1968903 RepID=UPI002EDB068C
MTGTNRQSDATGGVLTPIGKTPLVTLRRVVPPGCGEVVVKVEGQNPTGSMKDRMAQAKVAGAERDGRLRPGGTVVEYTGGSTGASVALVCAARGYRLRIVTSDAFSRDKLTRHGRGAAYTSPGAAGRRGRAGRVARALRRRPGAHRIEGIGIGYRPPMWDPEPPDEVLSVPSGEAEEMARRLAREEGLFAGTSSGANVLAAIDVARRLGPGSRVATLLVDSGLKYLSTGVYRR